MHEVGALDVGSDLHVGAERLQRTVRLLEARRGAVGPHTLFIAEATEGPDTDVGVRPGPQRRGQLGNMDTGTAVDLRRILPGQ
ncbi:hypothetical protein GCM10009627_09250 [Curtobacterium herbarum]|uniref:Uncharacterized protein n=1 Tax=Curtobacterium herbarum TaxID=150122 RepID=A0ABN1ZAG6_9MICO